MFWKDRFKVIWSSMKYRESWTFRPRQSVGLIKYLMHSRPAWRGSTAELNAYSPPVGGQSYRRYLQGLKRICRGDWTPLVAHVSVTDRCPYHCRRCSNIINSQNDPPLDKLAMLFNKLHSAGTSRVCLTGGEPALREDLPQIVEACGPALSPLLFTSGYGLEKSLAEKLRQAGLAAVFISLDHFAAFEHDRIRSYHGSFAKAINAIRACLHAGIYTAVQAVVEPSLLLNNDLERFLEFCRELEVDEIMLLEPVSVGQKQNCARLDESSRKTLAQLHLRAAGDPKLPKISSMSWLESPECLGCQAGLSFIYVSAQGEVFPCDFTPISFGNIYELELPEIQKRLQQVLKRPSQTCLALRLEKQYRDTSNCFFTWDQAQNILRDYESGPLPALFQYLYHG
jgi:radical SAM protein with 4Fe4S-binding SPASM domain